MTAFVPARGLGHPDVQTLLSYWRRPRLQIAGLVRERWETQDDDFIDVDRLPATSGAFAGAPHVLILHGLEGSSHSGYVLAMLAALAERGWGATALNFRSCSDEPNRVARSYTSGDTSDARWVLQRLREKGETGPLLGVGFSLGANVLLKLLAEDGADALLAAAVAVSTPFDLSLCAQWLDSHGGMTAFYRRHFLRTLRHKALEKAARFPKQLDAQAIRAARSLEAFDDAVTAPLNGYPTAQAYYRDASSLFRLESIRRPTLLLSSKDDPMVPIAALPKAIGNPQLTSHWTDQGGHVGFMGGTLWRPQFWAEEEAMEFLVPYGET